MGLIKPHAPPLPAWLLRLGGWLLAGLEARANLYRPAATQTRFVAPPSHDVNT